MNDEIIKHGYEIAQRINDSIPDFIKNFTKCEIPIEKNMFNIEFEKLFSKLFLTSAKKRQVGFLKFYKGKYLVPERLSVTGFDSLKSDTPIFYQRVLEDLYKIVLLHYNNLDEIKRFVNKVTEDLKSATIEDLIIKKRMSKQINQYTNLPIHIRALKNSNVVLNRGEFVNMLFVKDKREVIHYSTDLDQTFELDYKKYNEKFFKDKIELLDDSLYFKLFDEKNFLIDKSMAAILRKKQQKTKRNNLKTLF